jgi:TnpA family transposase
LWDTDTHGYTEINLAAFAMLGRRFCPGIRGLPRQRIYRIDDDRDYGPLGSVAVRRDRTIDTALIAIFPSSVRHLRPTDVQVS